MPPLRRSRAKDAGPARPVQARLRELVRGVRARREGQSYRLVRDLAGSFVILALVLGILYAATGGTWPPMVVVESGSMMHDTEDTSYGRIGTLDVGDIVFVRATKAPVDQIALWVDGGREHYGRPGDVVAFAQDGDRSNTTILHRAITYVEVGLAENGSFEYRVRWLDGETLRFGPEGIYLAALGFDERHGFTPTNGYRPAYSGFVTKGDNSFSNPAADQALGISELVDPAWVEGEVRGELPWMGLAKLGLQVRQTNPTMPGWTRVANGFAPVELWTCFFAVLGVVVFFPVTWDTWKLYKVHRARQEELRAIEEELRSRRRKAVEFETVTR